MIISQGKDGKKRRVYSNQEAVVVMCGCTPPLRNGAALGWKLEVRRASGKRKRNKKEMK